MKCERELSDQRKSRVVKVGGVRPAEEGGIMEEKLLYQRMIRQTVKEQLFFRFLR
jgi:hypothetical protein